MQLRGRGEAVQSRHVDVEDGDVGPVRECGGQDLVTASGLGHDGEVGLEFQQRDQGSADHMLVFRQQNPDHPLCVSGVHP
jgi:hypothetical protein